MALYVRFAPQTNTLVMVNVLIVLKTAQHVRLHLEDVLLAIIQASFCKTNPVLVQPTITLSILKAFVKSIFIAARVNIMMETIPANLVVRFVPHVILEQATAISVMVHHLR